MKYLKAQNCKWWSHSCLPYAAVSYSFYFQFLKQFLYQNVINKIQELYYTACKNLALIVPKVLHWRPLVSRPNLEWVICGKIIQLLLLLMKISWRQWLYLLAAVSWAAQGGWLPQRALSPARGGRDAPHDHDVSQGWHRSSASDWVGGCMWLPESSADRLEDCWPVASYDTPAETIGRTQAEFLSQTHTHLLQLALQSHYNINCLLFLLLLFFL